MRARLTKKYIWSPFIREPVKAFYNRKGLIMVFIISALVSIHSCGIFGRPSCGRNQRTASELDLLFARGPELSNTHVGGRVEGVGSGLGLYLADGTFTCFFVFIIRGNFLHKCSVHLETA